MAGNTRLPSFPPFHILGVTRSWDYTIHNEKKTNTFARDHTDTMKLLMKRNVVDYAVFRYDQQEDKINGLLLTTQAVKDDVILRLLDDEKAEVKKAGRDGDRPVKEFKKHTGYIEMGIRRKDLFLKRINGGATVTQVHMSRIFFT